MPVLCSGEPIYRSSTTFNEATAAVLVERVIGQAGPGDRLSTAIRRRLEEVYDADLSLVRVHESTQADQLCRMLGADAATCGEHILVRNRRRWSPRRDWLLAHEVAHVLQQRAGVVPQWDSTDHQNTDRLERLASKAADDFVAGRTRSVSRMAEEPPTPAERFCLQLHGSWEHRLLGDALPGTLAAIAAGGPEAQANLENWLDILSLWINNPTSVTEQQIAAKLPGVRTLRLEKSGLLLTYGELNALPDFVANPTSIMDLDEATLLPLLQVIRQEGYNKIHGMLKYVRLPTFFSGSPIWPWPSRLTGLVRTWRETEAVDALTINLGVSGSDHYKGVLARNACHFAPFTWHRFQAYNTLARQFAIAAHNSSDSREQNTQLAWQYAGYADHFLQDSFAAGHLINKTLVMQWFIEWVSGSKVVPVARWDDIKGFTTSGQPGLAGRDLYAIGADLPSNDPQTVEEYHTLAERISHVGLNFGGADHQMIYLRYLAFLSSMAAQISSALVHDYFNRASVWVSSTAQPETYQLWGDDTMLNGVDGVSATHITARNSQQAIADLLNNGTTTHTLQSLLDTFPTAVATAHGTPPQPIETWATGIEDLCKSQIFNGMKTMASYFLAPTIADVSQDAKGEAPTWSTNLSPGGGNNVSVLVVGDRLYATTPGIIYQLDPNTGAIGPKNGMPGYGYNDIHLAADHQLMFAGTNGYVAYIPTSDITKINGYAGLPGAGYTIVRPLMAQVLLLADDPQVDTQTFAGSNGMVFAIAPSVAQIALPGNGYGDTFLDSDGVRLAVGYRGGVTVLNAGAVDRTWGTWPLRVTVAENGSTTAVVCFNGRVYATAASTIIRCDPDTGEILNSVALPFSAVWPRMITDGSNLYLSAEGGKVTALDGNLQPLWKDEYTQLNTPPPYKGGPPFSSPVSLVLVHGSLFAAAGGWVTKINPATGELAKPPQHFPALYDDDYYSGKQEMRMDSDGVQLFVGGNGVVISTTMH